MAGAPVMFPGCGQSIQQSSIILLESGDGRPKKLTSKIFGGLYDASMPTVCDVRQSRVLLRIEVKFDHSSNIHSLATNDPSDVLTMCAVELGFEGTEFLQTNGLSSCHSTGED